MQRHDDRVWRRVRHRRHAQMYDGGTPGIAACRLGVETIRCARRENRWRDGGSRHKRDRGGSFPAGDPRATDHRPDLQSACNVEPFTPDARETERGRPRRHRVRPACHAASRRSQDGTGERSWSLGKGASTLQKSLKYQATPMPIEDTDRALQSGCIRCPVSPCPTSHLPVFGADDQTPGKGRGAEARVCRGDSSAVEIRSVGRPRAAQNQFLA